MWLIAAMASMLRTGMFLAGIALLVLILLRRTYRHYGRRRTTGKKTASHLQQASRQRSEERSLSDAPPDVLRWHVEMHETARELKAELDSKMRVLQLLIGQARHEADRLEQLLGHRETSGEYDDAAPVTTSRTRPPLSMDRQHEILTLADQGCSVAEIAAQLGTPEDAVKSLLDRRHGP